MLELYPAADQTAARAAAEANLAALCQVTDRIAGETSTTIIAGAVVNPAVTRTAAVTLSEVLNARASLAIGAGTSGIVVSAVVTGDDGAAVMVALVDPGAASASLAIARAGDVVTVTLATDPSAAIVTTAAEIVSAWRTSAARRVALAELPAGSDGSGTVVAAAAAPLVLAAIATADRVVLTAPPNAGLSVRTATVTVS